MLRPLLLFGFILLFSKNTQAQNLYFPPISGSDWETVSPASLGWCPDALLGLDSLLENTGTKSFILLKDGKIVHERYFNGHSPTSPWYWASAGKTITAFNIGQAQEAGLLTIHEPTSMYLGTGWTSCTPAQEAAITIQHQLTMTSGLDDGVSSSDCTDPTCLLFKADAGTRWAYHNAPYTLLKEVLQEASGLNDNQFTNTRLGSKIGMTGAWLSAGDNRVYWSTARNMVRFGLLMLGKGTWNGTAVLSDTAFFNQMIRPSQTLNKSYGYLWWLNGQDGYRLPGLQFNFAGSLCPFAPSDMVSAIGKNGQYLSIVPSENLVLVRMGENPSDLPVPITYQNDIWQALNKVLCQTNALPEFGSESPSFTFSTFPNPSKGEVLVGFTESMNFDKVQYQVFDFRGISIQKGKLVGDKISFPDGLQGLYILVLEQNGIPLGRKKLVLIPE